MIALVTTAFLENGATFFTDIQQWEKQTPIEHENDSLIMDWDTHLKFKGPTGGWLNFVVSTRVPVIETKEFEFVKSIPNALLMIAHFFIDRVGNIYLIGGKNFCTSALKSGVVLKLIVFKAKGETHGDSYLLPIDWSKWRLSSTKEEDSFIREEYVRI